MKKIVLITDFFPYSKSYETFIETEINYWSSNQNIEFIVLPMHRNSYKREIPKDIVVDDSFADFLAIAEKKIEKFTYKVFYIFYALLKSIFWRELFTKILKRPYLIKELLLSLRRYEIYEKFLSDYIAKNSDIAIFYTYWNTEVTYVLGALEKNYNYKTITRVHGYDLYLERTLKNYMPLREQFIDKIDRVFLLSNSAREYIIDTYGYKKEKTSISRLGVSDRTIVSYPSSTNTLHILSCSSLLPVKRIDKIIDILSLLSEKREVSIEWRHIGEGQLSKEIKKYAKDRLTNKNISYLFLGQLSNREVYEVYQESRVDIFINMSSSEGVPVSIMEAMSCSVPIIAPNIGGISDMLIDSFNGVLLDSNPNIEEVEEALEDISRFKDISMRNNSYTQYKKLYNSDKNYPEFIQEVEKIAQ